MKQVPHTVESAQRARDDTARWLYRSVFNWLVDQVSKVELCQGFSLLTLSRVQCNRIGSRFGDEAITAALHSRDSLTVSLVDTPGFETVSANSLEQFCANYAYEKLEQLFCNVIFKREVGFVRCGQRFVVPKSLLLVVRQIELYRTEGISFTDLTIHFNDVRLECSCQVA